MKKIAEGIGWLTIIYVGLYLIDGVVVKTGLDEKLDKAVGTILKIQKSDTQNETNESKFGFR